MPALIASFDVGTSGAKGILLDRQGHVLHEGLISYPTAYPAERQVEQSPDHWWAAVCALAQGFWRAGWDPAAVEGVALTGQMQDLILVDADLHALGAALLYSDTRAIEESASIRVRLAARGVPPEETVYLDPSSPLAKLVWLRAHAPERLASCRGLLFSAKDYALAQLAGVRAGDATTAATTGMLARARRAWRTDWLELLDLPSTWLPPLLPADQPAGQVTASAAARTGFRAGTPVFPGMGDAAAATLSAGLTRPGDTYLYLGTTAWAATLVNGTVAEDRGVRCLPYVLPDLAIAIAPLLNAGSAQQWVMALLGLRTGGPGGAETVDHAAFDDLLRRTEGRSGGALFLPYLNGERCPVQEPRPMGTFVGLGARSGPGEVAWAVMEGICFALRQVLETLGTRSPSVRLLGGMAQGALTAQVVADCCERTVQIPVMPAAAGALAAAMPVAAGLGWSPGTLEAVAAWFPAGGSGAREVTPAAARAAHYRAAYRRYLELYPLVRQLS